MGLHILIAEEEDSCRRHIARALKGNDVVEAASGAEAIEALRSGPFPLVVTSMQVGDVCGLTIMEQTKSQDPGALVVFTVGRAGAHEAELALRSGAHDCLVKPCDDILTSAALRRAIRHATLIRENQDLLSSLKRNVEALGLQNRKLQYLATRDGLTGLFNHRYFRETFDVELSRCRRYKRVLSLVLADVDNFKKYNDSQGHLAGDRLLSTLGTLITSESRQSTIVARYGGEEFAVIMPEGDREGAIRYAEKMRALVEAYPFEGRETHPGGRITMSLGVATYPENGTDADTLIKHADDALYRAKDAGRNAVCV